MKYCSNFKEELINQCVEKCHKFDEKHGFTDWGDLEALCKQMIDVLTANTVLHELDNNCVNMTEKDVEICQQNIKMLNIVAENFYTMYVS